MMTPRWPELRLIYATPNAAKRSLQLAAYMKAEGMKPGVPDLTLPVARGPYHGLYIEMKRQHATVKDVTAEQLWWIKQLTAQGYHASWQAGAEAAWKVIRWYLELSTSGT